MMGNYLTFNFGESYFRDTPVLTLIAEKLPVSISLGLWMTLLTYLISIPLGIRKAVNDGEPFDVWTSGALVVGYAVPGFLVAVLLLVVFAGSSFFQWFPSRGLSSEMYQSYSYLGMRDELGLRRGLLLASDAALDRAGAWLLYDDDVSHQELVSR